MAATKPLKEQNRPILRVVFYSNLAGFVAICHLGILAEAPRWAQFVASLPKSALVAALGLAASIVLNGQLPTIAKERLVFWRWQNPLPGHRAFSYYAYRDARLDRERLAKAYGAELPYDPARQNSVWYAMYQDVKGKPAVSQASREYLFTRDYAGFAAIFLAVFGSTVWLAGLPLRDTVTYVGFLVLQYLAARQSASTYGARLVTNVMALKSVAKEAKG
jgi:hypothetical protein